MYMYTVGPPSPFNKEWYQVLLPLLKWSLVPPDFKECCIRYS